MLYRQFGETDSDIEYLREALESDLAYSKSMEAQAISDTEKERWQGAVSQIEIQLSHMSSQSGTLSASPLSSEVTPEIYGTETTVPPPVTAEASVLAAGFDLASLSSNWPILAIVGVGVLLAIKGREKPSLAKHRPVRGVKRRIRRPKIRSKPRKR